MGGYRLVQTEIPEPDLLPPPTPVEKKGDEMFVHTHFPKYTYRYKNKQYLNVDSVPRSMSCTASAFDLGNCSSL